VDAKLIVADNSLFKNGHHLSLLKDDLVAFFGDHIAQIYGFNADEITLCFWKARDFRAIPVEGGRLVAANVLHNLPALISSETLHPAINFTTHLHADTKFLTLFCSARFCSIFGLFSGEHVVFRLCTHVPNIDRVVLSVRTDDAFSWASGECFRMELRAVLTKQTVLCAEGCNFGIHLNRFSSDCSTAFWDQLHVISCIPVCQGRLTETSEIVVKYYSEQHNTSDGYEHSCSNCYSSHSDDDAGPVMVSDFAGEISNNCNFLESLKMNVYLNNLQQSAPTHELNFTVLKDVARMKYFVSLQQSENISDELSVAVLSRQCASRLGIMNGNMLELLCKSHSEQQCNSRGLAVRLSESHQHSCRRKLVIARVNTKHSSDKEVAYLSSCAWFNLCSMSCMSLSGNCDVRPCYVKVCNYAFMCIFLVRSKAIACEADLSFCPDVFKNFFSPDARSPRCVGRPA